jgi:hypothetical protein
VKLTPALPAARAGSGWRRHKKAEAAASVSQSVQVWWAYWQGLHCAVAECSILMQFLSLMACCSRLQALLLLPLPLPCLGAHWWRRCLPTQALLPPLPPAPGGRWRNSGSGRAAAAASGFEGPAPGHAHAWHAPPAARGAPCGAAAATCCRCRRPAAGRCRPARVAPGPMQMPGRVPIAAIGQTALQAPPQCRSGSSSVPHPTGSNSTCGATTAEW